MPYGWNNYFNTATPVYDSETPQLITKETLLAVSRNYEFEIRFYDEPFSFNARPVKDIAGSFDYFRDDTNGHVLMLAINARVEYWLKTGDRTNARFIDGVFICDDEVFLETIYENLTTPPENRPFTIECTEEPGDYTDRHTIDCDATPGTESTPNGGAFTVIDLDAYTSSNHFNL